MSEGLMNIDLLWHIPECTYQQHVWMEVLELLQCWHGRTWLLTIPPFDVGLKRRRVLSPSQLRRITRLGCTHIQCVENHRPWWHDPLAQYFGIGGARYVSFLYIRACAKWGGVAKPRIVRGAFLFFACIGAANDTMQSWQRMGVMARLCKRASAMLGGAGR